MTWDEAQERATLTIPEAATLLGLSERSAYKAAQAGEIPARRIGGRWVVPVPLLRIWLGEQGAGNGATPADGVP